MATDLITFSFNIYDFVSLFKNVFPTQERVQIPPTISSRSFRVFMFKLLVPLESLWA